MHLIIALKGEKTEHAPVWVMRQAGRYLPGNRVVQLDFTRYSDVF